MTESSYGTVNINKSFMLELFEAFEYEPFTNRDVYKAYIPHLRGRDSPEYEERFGIRMSPMIEGNLRGMIGAAVHRGLLERVAPGTFTFLMDPTDFTDWRAPTKYTSWKKMTQYRSN